LKLTPEQVRDAVAEHGSIRKAAKALGRDDRTLRRILKRAEGDVPADAGKASLDVDHEHGTATATLPEGHAPDAVVELIRENGLDPDEWDVVTTTLVKWNGLGKADPKTGVNPVHTLRKVQVTLRRKLHLLFPEPVVHVPELARPQAPTRVSVHEPELILVEGDHQAPYFDPRLDALTTRLTHLLQPVEHVFLGDTGDYPTISRHADHPAAMAPVREVNEAVYGILRRRAEAAPNARRRKLKGNHDWRIEAELLARAERLFDLSPVGEDEPVWSLRRILHLDRLGVELVDDPRGWQHAEVELVPGLGGLVVRHGWLTGSNNVEKSLTKRGRSIIFGHVHTRYHLYKWDPSAGLERQATSLGAQCLVRHERFPHFAVCDDWLQGPGVVTRWRDGRFQIEHARYEDGVLTWRDVRLEA
jgi:hypothetical protein